MLEEQEEFYKRKFTVAAKEPLAEELKPVDRFNVKVFPNPSASSFNIIVQSPDLKEKIQLKVINITGQLVETKNMISGQSLRIGDDYRPGTYLIQAIQGDQMKTIKVIKLPD